MENQRYRESKEGVRLESPAVPYIATPDGLLPTKGAFVDKFVKFVKFLLLWVEIGPEKPPQPPAPSAIMVEMVLPTLFCAVILCVLFWRGFSLGYLGLCV